MDVLGYPCTGSTYSGHDVSPSVFEYCIGFVVIAVQSPVRCYIMCDKLARVTCGSWASCTRWNC